MKARTKTITALVCITIVLAEAVPGPRKPSRKVEMAVSRPAGVAC